MRHHCQDYRGVPPSGRTQPRRISASPASDTSMCKAACIPVPRGPTSTHLPRGPTNTRRPTNTHLPRGPTNTHLPRGYTMSAPPRESSTMHSAIIQIHQPPRHKASLQCVCGISSEIPKANECAASFATIQYCNPALRCPRFRVPVRGGVMHIITQSTA